MNSKKIISLLLCLIMVFTCVVPLASCSDKNCEHTDADKDGKCDKCGEAVTVDCTAHQDADNNGKCDNCNADMSVAPAGKTNYTINVKTIGGMFMSGVMVYVCNPDGTPATWPSATDDKGNVTFTLDTKSGYKVYLEGAPDGYDFKAGLSEDDMYPMGANGLQILLSSKPTTTGGLKDSYKLGDVMYDFTVTDINNKSYKLSDLLAEKRAVMLNFWYIDCSWCNKEFPGLNDSYANYKDKIEVLALNDYRTDSATEVKEFPTTGAYKDDNLTFPFFKITDSESLTVDKFGGNGYPTTVIIDRYGVVCMLEAGAIVGEAKWNKVFDYFTADKYTQKLIEKAEDLTPPEKPNIVWGGGDGIAANFNSSSDLTVEYSPDKDEFSWPFVPAEVQGVKVVKPSNKTDNSYGILYANIQLKPGQAVMFDYFSSCEYSNDRMVIIVDGNDICSLTGINKGDITKAEDWEMCCAYVDPRPITATNKDDVATYEVAFVYLKDTEISEGNDTVYLKNLRVIGVDEITTETYIIRDAVSDPTSDKGGFNTYVEYVLGSDGYYHVKDADGNAGPLLLANFLGYTNFDSQKTVSQRVMDAGSLMVGAEDKYYAWMIYANASANSEINGFTPVTEELLEILMAYCEEYMNAVGKDYHEDMWLQLCTYYDAYGQDKDGNPTPHVEDPIKGLTTISAFETDFIANPEVGEKVVYKVTYDRVVMPRGFLYRFSPKTSGVYRVTSHSDQEMIGWIFRGSSLEWMESESGDRDILSDFEEEERYCPALNVEIEPGKFVRDVSNVSLIAYMEAGKDYYIDIAYGDMYFEGSFEFDITYEGATFDAFVMASPGPVTYIETSGGGVGGLIALGIDYAFKEDADGIEYAYQVIKRDANGNPEIWGEKIYADFLYQTIPFPSQSIVDLAEIGAFDFSISELDRDALIMLENIRKNGKNEIITEWINSGNSNAANDWAAKDLDNIVALVQSGADVSSFNADDVAIAREALAAGELILRRAWGIKAIGSEDDWKEYKMEEALAGTLSTDPVIKETQQLVLAGIERLWEEDYKMDEVAKGIFHGTGDDETAAIERYIALMEDDTAFPERQGCVAVSKELSQLLSQLFSKYIFEDVQHDWLKFCFYYKQLGTYA